MSDIGFPLESDEDFHQLIVQASEKGEPIEASQGSYIKWSVGQGIELWAQVNRDNEVIGLNPHFTGTALMRVGLTERILRPEGTELDGAFHGWADPGENEAETGAYPFVFDVPDYRTYDDLKLPRIVSAQIAAFAHELEAFENDEAYEAHEASQPEGIRFAPESFFPSGLGLFTPEGISTEPPQAYAFFAGHVLDTAILTNPITKREFCWARVRTLGGEMDVVADPQILEGFLVKDGVVSGWFWLSGRIPNPPKEEKKNLWRKVFKS
jgi:hypothetical protein